MKICRRCVLPEDFPGLSLDDSGLCSICQREPSPEEAKARREGLKSELEAVYHRVRGEKDYDCLIAYSGGKDSSYTMYVLKERYGLRCLAITIDNGFLSEQAVKNCQTLTDAFGIDHVMYKPAFSFMKKMYTESLKGGVHVGAAVKRASAVCNSCICLINNHMLKTAFQMEIPIIAGGYLGGQVPKDAALFEFSLDAFKPARDASLVRFKKRFGDEETPKFFGLESVEKGSAKRSVFVTNPMLVLDVAESTILSTLEKYGWKRPSDTGRHSSNCRLNDLGIYTHLKQHGFHPYVAELAEQVRSGLMDRQEALDRLQAEPDTVALEPIAGKLDLHVSALTP